MAWSVSRPFSEGYCGCCSYVLFVGVVVSFVVGRDAQADTFC